VNVSQVTRGSCVHASSRLVVAAFGTFFLFDGHHHSHLIGRHQFFSLPSFSFFRSYYNASATHCRSSTYYNTMSSAMMMMMMMMMMMLALLLLLAVLPAESFHVVVQPGGAYRIGDSRNGNIRNPDHGNGRRIPSRHGILGSSQYDLPRRKRREIIHKLAAASAASSSATTTTSSSSSSTSAIADGLSRGDARGAAIRLENVSISRGNSRILNNIDWRIEPKAKWGLIGANGCGKSTLLKAIVEEISYDGKITVGTTQTVGYLQQTAVAGSTKTVFDEAASAMKEIQEARDKLYAAEQAVASHDGTSSPSSSPQSNNSLEQDLMALDQAMRRYEQVGGYEQEKQVGEMLHGLGFTNLTQPCNELSGGWQMRVSFAKMLLSKPSLALLDEPSNHLDRSARSWLAQYLRNYDDGAMILVTHDKELLESCQHIAEITSAGTMQVYKSCSYSQYLALKEERAKQALTEYEKNAEKAAKLQAFVDKYGASATKASAAQSRVKQIEKMQTQGLLDAPAQDIMEQRFKPRLNLPVPPKAMGDILLALQDNAMVGYQDESSSVTLPLIKNVHLEIQRGMKILIRGPNGAGKTTLLDSLRGTLPLLQGERIENESLRLGVFTQDLAQELDTSRRAVDLVTEYARGGDDGDINISDQQARTVLGGLGLTGDKALRKVGELSGGEKARVALGMFALKPSNLYLLDEVSNHLDIEWYGHQ
jgi:ATP-binding cassette, subfamily F, member 3